MTLEELKFEVCKYQYIEDTNIIDAALATIVATRLSLGDPIWLILIGASSGGKSQILRPLALTDAKFMHRIDDLTENTFLSGMKSSGESMSLLTRIGNKGMIVVSDLTVLFSKSPEVRATILSQFRMIYDGEMIKFSGNMDKPIVWHGHLGVLAGSTPSIYSHFEEVADMGERFIYYRMKSFDSKKATKLALERKKSGRELDTILSNLYMEYLKDVVANAKTNWEVSDMVKSRITSVSFLAERIRTTAHIDKFEKVIDRIPVSAMPMRVAIQLMGMARALYAMRNRELDDKDLEILDWCAYSLANEEKRACLKTLCGLPWEVMASTQYVADIIGLNTTVVRNILQNLSAVGVVMRSGSGDGLQWMIRDKEDWEIVRRIEGITGFSIKTNREVSSEEKDESDALADEIWNKQ